jgi:hypothetical protein
MLSAAIYFIGRTHPFEELSRMDLCRIPPDTEYAERRQSQFPNYRNVYIEPCADEAYKKMGVFPNVTIFYKQLQLTQAAGKPGGSRTEPSGRGYFPGKLNGADVTVKDTERFSDTGGWGYFNFHHDLPLAPTAVAQAKGNVPFVTSRARSAMKVDTILCSS